MDGHSASDTARLETFADGVFAIAITLLILEIRLPPSEPQGETGLFNILASLWPSYLGYTVSFIVIGIIWMNHHNFLKLIDHTDHNFLVLNLLLLMCVAFVPFSTRVLAEQLTSGSDRVAATAFYGGSFTLTGVIFNLLWRYATARRRLLRPTVSDWIVKAINKRYNPGPFLYLIATALAFVSVPLSLALIVGLAILYLLPYRPPSVEP